MTADEDDPQIQRNGFEAIVESVGLDPSVLEGSQGGDSFYKNHFDPSDSWEDNLARFRAWVRDMGGMINEVEEELLEATD